ncbi:hypothetical protein CSKR_109699 [Clonorchis sinensis]|uniref:Uncharacterized protein n=1 Tax=Clonorchis sinensis TaxID=79923 RepID=A0A419PFE8_CLOSI|nr:hypothetical protein CSKR_109699 [Clonorchis sinensis]
MWRGVIRVDTTRWSTNKSTTIYLRYLGYQRSLHFILPPSGSEIPAATSQSVVFRTQTVCHSNTRAVSPNLSKAPDNITRLANYTHLRTNLVLTRDPTKSLVYDVLQLNALHQAAPCFNLHDIRDIAIHCMGVIHYS